VYMHTAVQLERVLRKLSSDFSLAACNYVLANLDPIVTDDGLFCTCVLRQGVT
jgi:hypothetical protein